MAKGLTWTPPYLWLVMTVRYWATAALSSSTTRRVPVVPLSTKATTALVKAMAMMSRSKLS
ncbi:hypothetical protein D3C80_1912240 [compost metagenome]